MEKKIESEPTPLAIELMATHDRSCVTVIIRSNDKIPMNLLIPTLENFTEQLRAKFTRSAIDVQKPKIIMP